MKVLGWVLIVIWGLGGLYILADLISGKSADVYTDLLALVLMAVQIFFNYRVIKG